MPYLDPMSLLLLLITQVGTFVKTPKYSVWITCIEDRYSVVFCLNKDLISDWKAEKRFDLIYHDTLAQNDSPVQLMIGMTVWVHYTSYTLYIVFV